MNYGINPPSKEVLSWQRATTVDKLRRAISVGLRVKVRFANPRNISFIPEKTEEAPFFDEEGLQRSPVVQKPPSLTGHDMSSRVQYRHVMMECKRILAALTDHDKDNEFFNAPVAPSCAPGYSAIINEPSDFGTIQAKLEANEIDGPEEFHRLVSLVFTNACTYNPPDHEVHQAALKLQVFYEHGCRQEDESGILISMFDPLYKETIIKGARKVYSGQTTLPEESGAVFSQLKSLGRQGWLKLKDGKKGGRKEASDTDAKKST